MVEQADLVGGIVFLLIVVANLGLAIYIGRMKLDYERIIRDLRNELEKERDKSRPERVRNLD